ncbi:MAG: CAP domain-containing protein [Bacteroidales bacterium]|nr:CAP domain-containing protein [Bacteroidales bacterium]MBR4214723.1 CAP domain-containing protein [Bacteroidales bacterium]
MLKKLLLSICLLATVSIAAHAQIIRDSRWDAEVFDRANTAKDVSYLSDDEKSVICLCNLARLNGTLFANTYLRDYVAEKSIKSDYVQTLIRDLQKVRDLPMLIPDLGLCTAAANHASDIGRTGRTGHKSSDGRDLIKRFEKYFANGTVSENCSYGKAAPLDIVMQLLIDDGVESLGHRTVMLSKQYGAVGVSIAKHSVFQYNCVLDLYDSFL